MSVPAMQRLRYGQANVCSADSNCSSFQGNLFNGFRSDTERKILKILLHFKLLTLRNIILLLVVVLLLIT